MSVLEQVKGELARSHDLTLLSGIEASFTSTKKDLKKVKFYVIALASMCVLIPDSDQLLEVV